METFVWAITLALYVNPFLCQEPFNSTDPNKDMYVIHAMVYQVGIVSNKTEDDALNGTIGNQEAITLFHTNGSNIDLSAIPSPLMTNITAQSVVGVAPKTNQPGSQQLPWSALENLANQKQGSAGSSGETQWTLANNDDLLKAADGASNDTEKVKRSWKDTFKALFKREVPGTDTVRILKGSAAIPKAAGVQSIALPPLLSLNNNFTDIPVPIPNTSVVQYAKINTLVKSP